MTSPEEYIPVVYIEQGKGFLWEIGVRFHTFVSARSYKSRRPQVKYIESKLPIINRYLLWSITTGVDGSRGQANTTPRRQ